MSPLQVKNGDGGGVDQEDDDGGEDGQRARCEVEERERGGRKHFGGSSQADRVCFSERSLERE